MRISQASLVLAAMLKALQRFAFRFYNFCGFCLQRKENSYEVSKLNLVMNILKMVLSFFTVYYIVSRQDFRSIIFRHDPFKTPHFSRFSVIAVRVNGLLLQTTAT